jgi:hypothetical protein
MTATCFDENPHMKNALIRDQNNAKIGFALLTIGLFFQMLALFLQMI